MAASHMEATFAGEPASAMTATYILGAGSAVAATFIVWSFTTRRELSVMRAGYASRIRFAVIAIPVAIPGLNVLSCCFFSRGGLLALAAEKVLI